MSVSFPTTKQARRMFVSSMKRHNVEIIKSKTRDNANISGLDYDLWNSLWRNDKIRAKLRTVEFHVRFNNMDQLTEAMQEFESMLILSGKQIDTRKSWQYRYGSNHKIVKVLAVLE